MKYVYPQLSERDYGLFRVGGPGLANCLFFAARAHLLAKKTGCEMLRPTWERIGIGQWLRREKDKRFYKGLFRDENAWMKLRKAFLIRFSKEMLVENGLKNYFGDILEEQEEVKSWLLGEILPEAIAQIPDDMGKSIAVHIRLGDFPAPYRTDVGWYEKMIRSLMAKAGVILDVRIFSDGTDVQLAPVLSIPGVRRVFYGNALADMIAISRCGFLIGSDSTFSGWGAYLGQVPSVYPHLHYSKGGLMLKDAAHCNVCEEPVFPEELLPLIGGCHEDASCCAIH